MPIQVSDNVYIEYRYDPDYLQAKKYRKIKSYPDFICDSMGFKTKKTDLIIDGGNIVKCSDCVIMTDKVIVENSDIYQKDIIFNKLRDLFETDRIVLIPWDKKEDYLGHADGMVRFINEKTVLIQGYFDSYPMDFQDKLFGELEKNGLSWEKMTFDVKKEDEKRNWAYLNFLQTKDIILLPSLGIEEDLQAYKRINELFPDYSDDNIVQIDMGDIVADGGALNCITWTIRKN